jgi:hypothetical protein
LVSNGRIIIQFVRGGKHVFKFECYEYMVQNVGAIEIRFLFANQKLACDELCFRVGTGSC